MALEEHAGRSAGVEVIVVLGGDDRPETLERLLGVLRELETGGLLPLTGRVVRDLNSMKKLSLTGRHGTRSETSMKIVGQRS